jgi:hypothetical protein
MRGLLEAAQHESAADFATQTECVQAIADIKAPTIVQCVPSPGRLLL